jgi:UDP-glucose 4-epimerase
MNIVIGGLGFIGNELVRQLLGARENVEIVDNKNRIAPRIEDLAKVPIHEVDITNWRATENVFRERRPRVVFHLAAIHYIPECNANPERTLRVNVEGTMAVLNACSAAGVQHLVFASSGAVYDDSERMLNESSPVAPVDVYGWSKSFAEDLCRWHARQTGLRISICRLFNNYGPRETSRHIVPEIVEQLKSSDRLQLGNITPRRDYIHTSDCAQAMRMLAGLVPEPLRVVNIASGHHASVKELVHLMAEILNRKLEVVTDPTRFRKADKLVQVADISLLKRLTGWQPEVALRPGLTDLLRFEGLLP